MFKKIAKAPKQTIVKSIVFIIFAIYALSLIFPFAWMLVNSFKENKEFFKNIWALPNSFYLGNYMRVFTDFKVDTPKGSFNLLQMFLISIFVTVGGTFLNIMVSSMAAYVIAKYKFKGSNLIYSVAIFIMIVPIVGTLPSQYRLMQDLGLYNTIIGLFVLYSGGFGFNFFMMHGFFKSISWTYAEAAFVDGASDFKVFYKIMIPLAKPSMISLAIIHAIGLWNDFTTPSIYLKNYPTLAVGIRALTAKMVATGAYAEMFATMIISIIPIIILFVAFQKTIMENTFAGGIKG
jgi:ABC-type glycerol-3-phosphate transport system permease component